MKLKSLCFLLGSLFIIGCSSEVPVDQLTYKNGLKVLKESGEPFTGKSIRFEGGAAPVEIIEYKDGKLDGNIQFYYPNGEIKQDFYARLQSEFYMIAKAFDMGSRSRDTSTLDRGALKFLIRYGEEHKWHDNGEMASEGEYSEDGSRKVGEWRRWYKNGELEQEGAYSSLLVADEGKVRRRSRVDGIKIGQWSRWYDNGEINTEEFYNKEGQQNGIWKTYCKNGMQGKEVEYKAGVLDGTKKYWACDGKALDQENYVGGKKHGSFVSYVTKKRTALDTLINHADYSRKVEYDIKSEDYFKAKQGFFENGEKSGLWTTWDKTGKKTSILDYSKDNFLDPEYSAAFLKKGKFGPFASRYSRWKIKHFNFKDANPDIEATQLYLKRNLINPAKKIITQRRARWGGNNAGISRWTYPVIAAPEALYDDIKVYPGVRVDAVDTSGRNRLHLCTILLLGNKPGRCSIEHFKILVKDIPVNAEDNNGMAAMNYTAESYRSRRRSAGIEDIAIDAIKALVKAGADVNHQNAKGQTTLMRALSHKKYKMAKTLLDLGADVNVKDKEGHNVIHFVFFQPISNTYKYSFKLDDNRKEILTMLAQKGVKTDEPNLKQKTVKDVAIQKGAIKIALFLETLSELKLIEKVNKPVKPLLKVVIEDKPSITQTDVKEENKESFFSSNGVKKGVDTAIELDQMAEKIAEEFAAIEAAEVTVNQQDQLYQSALAQIKRSRLSRPKGNSALDTLNELAALTSENDSRVVEVRQKIVDKYLSLARGRINDYRFQDAVRFIETSQRIQPSKKATQLLARVNDKIAEERLYQQQRMNSTRQAAPIQRESSLESIFKSIFD